MLIYMYLRSKSKVVVFSMLMGVCPGGTEGSVREASLSKFLLFEPLYLVLL